MNKLLIIVPDSKKALCTWKLVIVVAEAPTVALLLTRVLGLLNQ